MPRAQRFRLAIALMLFAASATNGATETKANVSRKVLLAVWAARGRFLRPCLEPTFARVCQLEGDEKEWLARLWAALPRETGGIRFASEKEHPTLFVAPEERTPRVAVTGDDVGDPLVFNTDRLVEAAPSGKTHPFSPYTAVSLIAHELLHHHGLSHSAVETLAARVERGARAASFWIDLASRHSPQVHLFLINAWDRGTLPSAWFQDDLTFEDMGPLLSRTLLCPAPSKATRALWVSSLTWSTDINQDISDSLANLFALADVEATCAEGKHAALLQIGLSLEPDRPTSEKGWWKTAPGHLLPNSTTIGELAPEPHGDLGVLFTVEDHGPEKIDAGGPWHVTGTIELPDASLVPRDCAGMIGGHFYSDEVIPNSFPPMDSCRLEKLDARHFRARLSHTFLGSTWPGWYRLAGVRLRIRGRASPLLVFPDRKVRLRITSSHPAPDMHGVGSPEIRSGDRLVEWDELKALYRVRRDEGARFAYDMASSSPPIEAVLVSQLMGNEGLLDTIVADLLTRFFPLAPWVTEPTVHETRPGLWRVEAKLHFPAVDKPYGKYRIDGIYVMNREYRQAVVVYKPPVLLELD